MAVGQQEAVTLFPLRVVRPVMHGVEVGDRQYVSDTQRLGDVALSLNLAHAQCMQTDMAGALVDFGDI